MDLIIEHDGRRYFAQIHSGEPFQRPFAGEQFPCLVWDHVGGTDFERKKALARQVMDSGCRYAVCAGIDCSDWHDAFDMAWIAKHAGKSEHDQDAAHVQTTWHERDSVDDIAYYFVWNTNFDDLDFRQFLVRHVGDSPVRHEVDAAVRKNALGDIAP